MPYSISKAPRKIGYAYAQGAYGAFLPRLFNAVAADTITLWEYITSDGAPQIQSSGYFSNGAALGMAINDIIICRGIPQEFYSYQIINTINTDGSVTVADTLPPVLSYTWATRPNPFATAPGTIVNFSDIGGPGGTLWRATPDGYVPVSGSVTLASNWGTLASPIATQTGSTGALFVPTVGSGSLIIPATMLIAGKSKLEIEFMHRRRGATATALLSVYLGTAGTTGDSTMFGLSLAATNNLDARPEATVGFTTGVATTSSWLAPGGALGGAFVDRTTNINLAASMTISFGISSANAADSFDLVGYSLTLRSI